MNANAEDAGKQARSIGHKKGKKKNCVQGLVDNKPAKSKNDGSSRANINAQSKTIKERKKLTKKLWVKDSSCLESWGQNLPTRVYQ